MELLLPQLLVEEQEAGWRCKKCGDNGFKSRDRAIFHVESEHVYYDQEEHKWCGKISNEEYRVELEAQRFQEQLNDFCRVGLCAIELFPIPGFASA